MDKDSFFFKNLLILFSIFSIAVCGLVYELLAGTISSYLLGDSIYQFSIVIGFFMSSMGLGSFLTRFLNEDLPMYFIFTEVLLGLIGGLSSIALFFAFTFLDNYTFSLFLSCILIGTLIGFEIPLIIRILKNYYSDKFTISNVLTVDYIGALIGAILFPLLLVPKLGLIKTSLMFGIINILAAFLAIYVFKNILTKKNFLLTLTSMALLILILAFTQSYKITSYFEDNLYRDEIIFTKNTKYQKLVFTKRNNNILMFINGGLQFNSKDEYRYHESLIHPAMSLLKNKDNILILGGGDGLAAREILKYKNVKSITLVDIDSEVTNLFKNHILFKKLNDNSLHDKKVKIFNTDAWKFLENNSDLFNAIFIDLPDPISVEISKLYTNTFYKLVSRHLSFDGIMVTQSTSPLFSNDSFSCIYNTINSIETLYEKNKTLNAKAYHVYIPSFGEWGFVMASNINMNFDKISFLPNLKFLNKNIFKTMLMFPSDMKIKKTDLNTLDTHSIIQYYENNWSEWFN